MLGELRIVHATCKHGDPNCGRHWHCDACTDERRQTARNKMSASQRAYDRHVDPLGVYTGHGPATGCSCHLSAPCDFCVNESEES